MLTFNVSGGSHQRAVYQHATLSLYPFVVLRSVSSRTASTLLYVMANLVVAVSWGVASLSSFSEYWLGEALFAVSSIQPRKNQQLSERRVYETEMPCLL